MKHNFLFGIEHEIPLISLKTRKFLDYQNLSLNILNKVVQKFPVYQDDYPGLRIGDLGIKVKRVYIEGLEIFDSEGFLAKQYPKGLELRTKAHHNIDDLINELYLDFQIVRRELRKFNIQPTFISFNPFKDNVKIRIRLHKFEKKLRRLDQGRVTAPFTLLTYGPDINISNQEFNDTDVIQIVKKLIFYTPFIIPFSFSSPFFKGKLWKGQSIRCFKRLKLRPAAIGFVSDKDLLQRFRKKWILNEIRIPREKGRVEYKAIDTVKDLRVYKGLLVLLKGLILDKKLNGQSLDVDLELVKLSCLFGFDNKVIYEGCFEILSRAKESLKDDKDKFYLEYLFSMLKLKNNFSINLINDFKKMKSIGGVLLKHNNFIS